LTLVFGGGGFGGGGGGINPGKNAGNGKNAGGGSSNADKTKVLNGFYGSNAGLAPGTGSGSGNSGNGAGRAGAGGVAKIDLKQFLPGGKFDPKRGLAGISGPDGITGPSSDIFAKVNIRYRAVTTSLRP
jgi:hypothetical protein